MRRPHPKRCDLCHCELWLRPPPRTLNEHAHKPALLREALAGLEVRADGCYVDCTYGRGGHSRVILQRLGERGRLYAFDKDPAAVGHARHEFVGDARFNCMHESFTGLSDMAKRHRLQGLIDGVLLDLGVSSPQLDEAARGFSFTHDGPLDMRMNPERGISAAQWLNQVSESELSAVLRDLGEERYARRIARAVTQARLDSPVTTTRRLAELIRRVCPAQGRDKHPATRSFLAIRTYINNEQDELRAVLAQTLTVLREYGRLAVISFHSGEDRIVKRFIRAQQAGPRLYPRYLPVREQAFKPRLRMVGRAIRPGAVELRENPRSRSAVLRVAEKLPI